ncbi:maleylacetoacetate isomerase [Devosia sp. SL43]|uniref:maleylacetoacetate isomerase n=1 Tax=Devosia sp. SL43 TaxID=2806348 RepID=UPI001F00BE1D|nr:maleylacetoacetate isomerase [Devosia sp. SL43]UJW86321.1 maleylacetoacetate isomerase [Devosia sp. SL43]
MKLYTKAQNSAGERVRIALNLKALDYEYVGIGGLPRGEYARINPQGLMPALEIDGAIITQSAAILDFLENRFPERPILPSDPVLRAQSLAFGAIVASEMHALTVNRVRKRLTTLGVSEEGVVEWVLHWQGLGLASLEALLARRETAFPFCYGEAPGWADLHLVPQMAAARRLSVPLAAYSLLLEVEARCADLPAFAAARPEAQPDYSP